MLVLGDLHIPHRVDDIPEQFKSLLVPNKMQHVLCTGNLVSSDVLDFLKTIAPKVHIVRGDFDDANHNFPPTTTVQIGEFKIGLIHGHQVVPWGDPESLANVQRDLNVDILITGHTHKNDVFEYQGGYIINPGSATGSMTPLAKEAVLPSFVLMAIKGDKVVTYIYELRDGSVSVSKNEFTKK